MKLILGVCVVHERIEEHKKVSLKPIFLPFNKLRVPYYSNSRTKQPIFMLNIFLINAIINTQIACTYSGLIAQDN